MMEVYYHGHVCRHTELRSFTRSEIADAKSDTVRWTLLTMMGFATMLASAVYFLLQNIH